MSMNMNRWHQQNGGVWFPHSSFCQDRFLFTAKFDEKHVGGGGGGGKMEIFILKKLYSKVN